LDDPYDDDVEDDEDEFAFERRRRRRRYLAPHRGGTILTLGILSIVLVLGCTFAGFIGIAPWTMATADLRAMREGQMDPEGRGTTIAGMIMGIIGIVLGILTLFAVIAMLALN
jgi:hypothetical protein